jgi:hypothetical protein
MQYVLALVSVLEIALAQSFEVPADSGLHAIESRDGGCLLDSFRVRLVIPVAHTLLQLGSSLVFFLCDLNPLVRFYLRRRNVAVDQRH